MTAPWRPRERGFWLGDAPAGVVLAQLAPAIGFSRAIGNRFLDAHAARTEIDKQLAAIERIARRAGSAAAVGHAFPVTLERLDEWLPTLAENGLALVPIGGGVDRQLPP